MVLHTSFFRTIPGILKVLEIIFSFVGLLMILIKGDTFNLYTSYTVATMVALIVALLILILYISGVSEMFGAAMNLQTYFHLIWMIYVVSYSAILLNSFENDFKIVSAGVFGFLLAVTYLVDGIYAFVRYPPMPFAS